MEVAQMKLLSIFVIILVWVVLIGAVKKSNPVHF